MSEERIGCLPVPCTTCPYRCDVPSGVWAEEEYQKLPAYDRPTWEQPAALFMCHQKNNGLCTGWLQSHANRPHDVDLLALRMNYRKLDVKQVSGVALSKPIVALFRSGAAAMRHGLKAISRPGRKAKQAMQRLVAKRKRDN
jgi:hypothetical protein